MRNVKTHLPNLVIIQNFNLENDAFVSNDIDLSVVSYSELLIIHSCDNHLSLFFHSSCLPSFIYSGINWFSLSRSRSFIHPVVRCFAHSLTFGALKSESFKPPADTEQPAGATSSVECQTRGVVAEAERCLWGWDALSLWKQVLARSVIGLDTLHPSPVIYLSGMPSACEGFKKKSFFFFNGLCCFIDCCWKKLTVIAPRVLLCESLLGGLSQ